MRQSIVLEGFPVNFHLYAQIARLSIGLKSASFAHIMVEMEFINFLPEDEIQNHGNAMLKRIMEQAPYAAAGSAFVEFRTGLYKARIIVKSESEQFDSTSLSPDCRQAMERVEQQIYHQIARWRENRFKSNDLGLADDVVVRPTFPRRAVG